MIEIFRFNSDVIDFYDKIYPIFHNDLKEKLNDDSLYKKDIEALIDYKELILDKNQQEVVENYINSLLVEADNKAMIAYLKGIEHTLKYLKKL